MKKICNHKTDASLSSQRILQQKSKIFNTLSSILRSNILNQLQKKKKKKKGKKSSSNSKKKFIYFKYKQEKN